MNPLVPFLTPKPCTRNRSAAYNIFRMATDIKNCLIYLADTPFISFVSLWYCVTHFVPFCSAYCKCSFHHSSWFIITPGNLCVVTAGTFMPLRDIALLHSSMVFNLAIESTSLLCVSPMILNLSNANFHLWDLDHSSPPPLLVIIHLTCALVSFRFLPHTSSNVSSMNFTASSPLSAFLTSTRSAL